MMKIILNADDFGKSPERNRAVDDAFKQGLIRSAGLIVTGKHLQNAVNYMFEGNYVDKIHLHFNLSTGLLHEDPEDIPLTVSMKKDSFFCENGRFREYHGLPTNITSIRKWKMVFKELVAQFELFKKVTKGKADYKHVDFHLWYNLTWPVAIALNLFTWKFKIETIRYWGIHQMCSKRYKLYRFLSWNPRVKYIPATNIDYYLSKRGTLDGNKILELYCHPNYKNGIFLDDSPSYLGHERQPLLYHIERLRQQVDIEFVSWEEYLS